MKFILTALLLLLLTSLSFGQHVDTSKVNFNGHTIFDISNSSYQKLIIFLHGGVQNPYFEQSADKISLNYLVEGNDQFLKQAEANGFDVIAPLTNSNLDWLTKPDSAFKTLWDYIDTKAKTYQEVYITGFSDGGTGSYKIFYKYSSFFDGLVVFNGFPQHLNHNKTVDYSKVANKTIAFFGTFGDKTIAYEFLMVEYRKQKKYNANTFLYLEKGSHSFKSYNKHDLEELFAILTKRIVNTNTEIIHGFVKNDSLITLYPFRKKITKQYRFGEETYQENLLQMKNYKQ